MSQMSFWELHAHPRLPLVPKNSLANFDASFMEHHEHNLAKVGQLCIFWCCGLTNSAAILRRPVRHVVFLEKKNPSLGPKMLGKPLRANFGFSSAIPCKFRFFFRNSAENFRRVPPCAVKTCAVRPFVPFLHGWWGSCGQQIQAMPKGP